MKPIVVMTQTQRYDDQRAEIVHLPFVTTEPLPFDQTVLYRHYDWLVFTSKNAVTHFQPYLKMLDFNGLAVIGAKTKAFCESQGLQVDFYPADYSQEGFLDAFPTRQGQHILIPSSQRARPLLHETLQARGFDVKKIDLYTSRFLIENVKRAKARIEQGQVDALTFASASAVKAFFDNVASLNFDTYYAIGQQTAHQIQYYGYSCSIADVQTLEAMVTKILEERVQ
ncbi:uroporphyrinogen-III synthase [Staphylococcus sp. MI 10-1553]|uniref:uroporphyrinogen-III synthase n=1 Tax=Staphylococcus sp. MI 10-1553 TaxID=1912064 RepID=UPI00193A5069|nr:uroporphyrinogen-III synthase [Staphylococcus sp. MI 10-1553]